jgi:cysteine desulfurase family protein
MKDNIIYFNNAATTWPKPQLVTKMVNKIIKHPIVEKGRTTTGGDIDYVETTRDALAEFFNVDTPDNFIFTSNATDSLNLLILGFVKNHKSKKFHVITTELEHNSVLRPLKTLERDDLIDLSVIPFNENKINIDDVKKAITSETRLFVMTHGSNVLGSIQDINEIGEYLKSNDIFFIVDGAQTAGQVKINLSQSPVDAFVFTGHKSLFGFTGIGGFLLNEPDAVDAIKQGGTGIYSNYLYQPQEMPLKFETGTHNYIGIASLYAGIQYLNQITLPKIELKCKRMTEYIISRLAENDNICIYNKNPELPIISFNINSIENDEVGLVLMNQYKIIVRTGLHCAPLVHKKIDNGNGCVRLSLSYLNSKDECEYVADAITKIAQDVN